MDAEIEAGEYSNDVHQLEKGRKHRMPKEMSSQVLPKISTRYSKQNLCEPDVACSHASNKKRVMCSAGELNRNDIVAFRNLIYANEKKIEQDKILLKFMDISAPKRKTREESSRIRNRKVSIKYSIKTPKGNLPVCASTFQKITGASKDRLSGISNKFLSGELLVEKRGGRKQTQIDKDVTEAIKNHISSYKCRESHYSRSKCRRSYLPPELNIERMYKAFCDGTNFKCSLSKYKKIFYQNFNLGFGNPHSDTCFICKELLAKIKKTNMLEKKNELRVKYRLHKMRAKAFFRCLNNHKDNTIKVCFDCQQNQPLPKMSVGEVLYSRQVWLYNLGIVRHQGNKQKKDDISFYVWLETQAGRGSNEIASGLLHYLKQLHNKLIEEGKTDLVLELFSDSCSAQNKNSIIMAVLLNFLENSSAFKEIVHFFPIRGHSFMPPDRVFGRVEKDFRKREDILVPTEYYKILQNHGTVNVWGQDWKTLDHKTVAQNILKRKLPFKMTEVRALTYKKTNNNAICKIRSTYFGSDIQVDIFKKGIKNANQMRLACQIPSTNHVSDLKKADVKKLLRGFSLTEEANLFYNEVMKIGVSDSDDNIGNSFDDTEIDV